jgi:hypothetical protein
VLSNGEISKGFLKKYRNKGKIKASIAETFILEEVSNFTTTYYAENLPSVHNPPLVTILAKINRTLAFSEGNSEVQVHRPLRTWNLKRCAVSCYMCWPTLMKWSHTWGKFSTRLFNTPSLFCIQPRCFSLVQGISSSILASIKGSYPVGI